MAIRILNCDVMHGLAQLADQSVHCVVTSPPYWGLRDYGIPGQIGLEPTPDAFVARLVDVFREVKRVLRDDGTLWLNLGDTYAAGGMGAGSGKQLTNRGTAVGGHMDKPRKAPEGLKPKDLVGIPWRVALALQADGWYLRSDIIWAKPNPMPESVTDRPTKSHEYVFLLTKAERYFYDAEAIKEPAVSDHASGNGFKRDARLTYQNADGTPRGNDKQWVDVGGNRNKRSVWSIATISYPDAHFATFPPDLPELCVKAGTSQKGCCVACGAPYARVLEVESRPNAPACNGKYDGNGKHRTIAGGVWNDARNRIDMGWQPGCECAADMRPCTVLDPFSGAGTTALVADRLQRDAIGIELNPEYSALSSRRLDDDRGGLLDMMEAR